MAVIVLPPREKLRKFAPPLKNTVGKLGKDGWHFSIPPGDYCPGKSEACEKCYAMQGRYLLPSTQQSNINNEELRRDPRFVSLVCAQITLDNIWYVRVHSAGDFDTATYIEDWIEIAKRRPQTTFWAYTRSWSPEAQEVAGEDLLSPLLRLASLPNFQLWFSCDRHMPTPPRHRGVYRAYMAMDDTDRPRFKPDLVFRVDRRKFKTSQAGTTVCPAERKRFKKGDKKLNCVQCKLCFSRVDWILENNKRLRNVTQKD